MVDFLWGWIYWSVFSFEWVFHWFSTCHQIDVLFTVFIIITFRLVIEFVVEILLYFAKYTVEILICTICWNNGINHSSFNQVTI